MTEAIDYLAGLVRYTDLNESISSGDAGEDREVDKAQISLSLSSIWNTTSTPLVHRT